jgi:hypothetical protein
MEKLDITKYMSEEWYIVVNYLRTPVLASCSGSLKVYATLSVTATQSEIFFHSVMM